MTVASDIHTMQPGDIYEDKHGIKWAVAGFWTDPVVLMEQVWPPTEGESRRQQAGIHGLLWDGFRKLAPTQAEGER